MFWTRTGILAVKTDTSFFRASTANSTETSLLSTLDYAQLRFYTVRIRTCSTNSTVPLYCQLFPPGRTFVRKWEKISHKGRSGCAGLRGCRLIVLSRRHSGLQCCVTGSTAGPKGDAAPQSQRFYNLSLFSAVIQGGGVESPPPVPSVCSRVIVLKSAVKKNQNPGGFLFLMTQYEDYTTLWGPSGWSGGGMGSQCSCWDSVTYKCCNAEEKCGNPQW